MAKTEKHFHLNIAELCHADGIVLPTAEARFTASTAGNDAVLDLTAETKTPGYAVIDAWT